MATLAGNTIASTYPLLLKIASNGLDTNMRTVEDGDGTDSALSLATNAIAVDATDKLYFDGGSHTYIHEVSADKLDIVVGNQTILEIQEGGGGASDSVSIQALNRLYFDGGSDTYIHESSADVLKVVVGGDEFININEGGTSAFIINEGSIDMDFRIESDGNANMFYIDGGLNVLGIGGAPVSSNAKLQVYSGTDSGPHATIYGANNDGVRCSIFADDADNYGAFYTFDENDGSSAVYTKTQIGHSDGAQGLIVDGATGNVGIGTNAPNANLHLLSTTDIHPDVQIEKTGSAGEGGGVIGFLLKEDGGFPNDNENIGTLVFRCYDTTGGDSGYHTSASIRAEVEGTQSNNVFPGTIVFAVNAGGTGTTDRVRIDEQGHLRPVTDDYRDLGQSGSRWDDVYATNGTIQTSDLRSKESITNSTLGLAFVNKLRPISYKWKDSTHILNVEQEDGSRKEITETQTHSRTHYGLIAQEVKTVLDDLSIDTKDFAGYIDGNVSKDKADTYGLRYGEFIAPLIKAIQELSAKVTALESKDTNIDSAITTLTNKDTSIDSSITTLTNKDASIDSAIAALTTRVTALESA